MTAAQDKPGERDISGKLDILQASLLVQDGQFAEAEQILLRNGFPPRSVAELDLLARIEVQKGDDEQARNLWMMALKIDPDFSPAREALAVLASPWRLRQGAIRVGRIVAYGLVGALAFFGLWRLGIYQTPVEMPNAIEPVVADPAMPENQNMLESLRQLPAASVNFTVIPPFPIFAEGASWGGGGAAWTAELAQLLSEASSNFFIRVVVRATSREVASMPDIMDRRIDALQSVLASNKVPIRTWWATGISRRDEEGRTPYFVLVRKN